MSCTCQNGTTVQSSIYAALLIIALALYGTMDDQKDSQPNSDFAEVEAGLDTIAATNDNSHGDTSP